MNSGIGQSRRHFVCCRLHQRAVERCRDIQRNGARAQFLGLFDGQINRSLIARDNDIALVVVVGDNANASCRTGLGGLFGQCQIGFRTDQRSHSALAHRHSALHGLTAQLQQADGVGQ